MSATKMTRVVDLAEGAVIRIGRTAPGVRYRVVAKDDMGQANSLAPHRFDLTLNPTHMAKDVVRITTLDWDFEVEQEVAQ